MTEALQQTIDGGEIDHWEVVGSRPPVAEGDTCDKCGRRVPHSKKKSSPTTKVLSVRVPLDDVDALDELWEQAARHAGVYEKPHWKFWAIHYALVALLQLPADEVPNAQ